MARPLDDVQKSIVEALGLKQCSAEWVAYRQKWFADADKREALLREKIARLETQLAMYKGTAPVKVIAKAVQVGIDNRRRAKAYHADIQARPKDDPKAAAHRAKRAAQARARYAKTKAALEKQRLVAEIMESGRQIAAANIAAARAAKSGGAEE